ncbi:MAG: response regulator transcription factor [Flavobacteriales bacterium]|nr:response regulator transcription factor [Flavobacteriales bacterium]
MIKVLLVDDSAIIRKAVKQFLLEEGVISVVGECSDGREVLGFLKSNQVDVILMDVSMKYIGGIEATKLVKQKHSSIKVIGFSSHSSLDYQNDMLTAGASGYIVKGVEIKVIRDIIKSVMKEVE